MSSFALALILSNSPYSTNVASTNIATLGRSPPTVLILPRPPLGLDYSVGFIVLKSAYTQTVIMSENNFQIVSSLLEIQSQGIESSSRKASLQSQDAFFEWP